MLSVLSSYINSIPRVEVDGIFGPATRNAVIAAQRYLGLPQTGAVDEETWDEIYDQFAGIENTALRSEVRFPAITTGNSKDLNADHSNTSVLRQYPGEPLRTGNQDPVRQEVVR